MKAKCVKFYEFGKPQDVLTVESKDIQALLKGEVLVRMKVRPINPSDIIPITGAYAHRIPLPTIPGYEGVGVIEAIGQSVSSNLLGQRVLPLRGEGTWQEYVKSSAELVVQVPNSIDDYTAAQLYINPLTAWITCTSELQLGPGDTLLVNACGSAIGRIYAQLSKILGFQLIAVTRNSTYTKELLELEAAYVINTAETPLQQTVMALTNGRGADAAIDSVGGSAGSALAFCVRPNGTLLTIGLLSGTPVNWAEVTKKAKVHIKLFHLRHWNARVSVHTWQETFNHLIEYVSNERLNLMKPTLQFDLTDVKEAICMIDSPISKKGKVFLTSF